MKPIVRAAYGYADPVGGRRADNKRTTHGGRNNESGIRTRCKTGRIWMEDMTSWAGGLAGRKEGMKGVGISWNNG